MEYVKNHEIVLNVGFEATSGLQLGNEFIEFKARFGGVSREITVPVGPRGGHLRARERPGHGLSHAQRSGSRWRRARGCRAGQVRPAPGAVD
jgi:stringent starvation protein B